MASERASGAVEATQQCMRAATDGGNNQRRVDEWALQQQAHSANLALSRARVKTGHVTNPIYNGGDDGLDELNAEDFHYAWSALTDAVDELVLLAHLSGYERLTDVEAITFGEATDEEIARFERGRK